MLVGELSCLRHKAFTTLVYKATINAKVIITKTNQTEL